MSRPRSTLALRFMSGKYQGALFPLGHHPEIRIGRQPDFELALVEDMVSRHHARIFSSSRGGDLIVEDLGSTNGTFVNGKKVSSAVLREGDRLLVGASLMRVVPSSEDARSDEQIREDLAGRGRRTAAQGRLAGNLTDVPVPDLLQLLSGGKKTGSLRIKGNLASGSVHLQEGSIIDAELDDVPNAPARKALFRMLGWAEGTFEFHGASGHANQRLYETTEALLLDAMVDLDELGRIADALPDDVETLALAQPLETLRSVLGGPELTFLEIVQRMRQVGAIVDAQQMTDTKAYKTLVSMLERGYLVRN